jgi:hypothetical protein
VPKKSNVIHVNSFGKKRTAPNQEIAAEAIAELTRQLTEQLGLNLTNQITAHIAALKYLATAEALAQPDTDKARANQEAMLFEALRSQAALPKSKGRSHHPKPAQDNRNWMQCEDGCNDLKYGCEYNEETNTIDIGFAFFNGVREPDAVIFHPFGLTRQFAGGFTSREEAKRIAHEAFRFLTTKLGDSINAAIHFTVFEALLYGGYKFNESMNTASKLKKKLLAELGQLTSRNLGVKKGAKKGSKQSKVQIPKSTLELEMNKAIRELVNADEESTRAAVSRILRNRGWIGLNNARALDRLRTRYQDNRRWGEVVAEAMQNKKGR